MSEPKLAEPRIVSHGAAPLLVGLLNVELAAREYAAFSHGNLSGDRYRAREEARDRLLDALSRLEALRQKAA